MADENLVDSNGLSSSNGEKVLFVSRPILLLSAKV